jgi:peptidoglycan/xylan/chitin deacetylase (PgdA/CDA1 family)
MLKNGLLFLLLLGLSGCMPELRQVEQKAEQKAERFPDFLAIFAEQGDTFESLAAKHLNNPRKGWIIAEFNRLDRLVEGQPVVIPLGPYRKGGLYSEGYQTVPVLTYHNFSRTETNAMTVLESAFEAQMAYLKQHGYRVITLDELYDFIEYKNPIPPQAVLITVDDGWRPFYDIAFPILKKYRYPATLFVYTDLITGTEKTLNWRHIKEMAEEGIEIECHTQSHRYLDRMVNGESFQQYVASVQSELNSCPRILEQKLGVKAKYLAYPFGATNLLVSAMTEKYNYSAAFTVDRGSNPFYSNPYQLKRSMIYGSYDLNAFVRNLKTIETLSWQ